LGEEELLQQLELVVAARSSRSWRRLGWFRAGWRLPRLMRRILTRMEGMKPIRIAPMGQQQEEDM
jgi:hypothetical protein